MRHALTQFSLLFAISCGVAFSQIAQASPPVTLDPTFGTGGILQVRAINPGESALQTDGKLLVRVYSHSLFQVFLTRFNRDGTPDVGFGNGGFVQIQINGSPLYGSGNIISLGDGRILTTATATTQPCVGTNCQQTIVVRLLANGALDSTFGTGGYSVLALDRGAQGNTQLALQQDGKIIALENYSSGGFFPFYDSKVERLAANGSAEIHWSNPCLPLGSDVAAQLDGKIVVAGPDVGPLCIARFNIDGTLDSSFGNQGIVQLASSTTPSGPTLLIDPRDALQRITVTRRFGGSDGSGNLLPGTITRLLANGAIDPAFGDGANNHGALNYSTRLAPSCGAKLLGAYGPPADMVPPEPASGLNVVRYNGNGTRDVTFSGDSSGQILTPLDNFIPSSPDLRTFVRDDGDIVVVGPSQSFSATDWDLLVAVYRQSDCTDPNNSQVSPVIEFYNASLDHYFITSAAADMTALDSGHFQGWQRTGYTFATVITETNPVCRFYIPPAYGDSHFFSASPAECSDVQAKFPQFILETSDAMRASVPDVVTGVCMASTTVPVYRVWDQRSDANHRYITDRGIRDAMVASGWVAEGYGPDAVAMCTPSQ